jgi:hypothetical protein
MNPKEALDKLHSERGDFRKMPLTIPGKGHWLWGLYTRMYIDRGMDGW